LIRDAGLTVRILDTSSTLLLSGRGDRSARENPFAAVSAALRRGASLQILLMEPDSDSCRARAEEIGRPDLAEEIRANLRWLAELADQEGMRPDAVEVRLYDKPPSISVYQVDDFVISGFMPYGARSSVTPHFGSSFGHGLLASFTVGQFDQLWNAGRDGHTRPLSFEALQQFRRP
jgi:hypothetical protein